VAAFGRSEKSETVRFSRPRQAFVEIPGGLYAMVALPVRHHVDKTFPFDKAAEAHAYIEARRNIGKVVLTP